MSLRIVPITLEAANAFVKRLHRHNGELPGAKFSVGVADEAGTLRGVAIIGNPSARALQDGRLIEIRRVCTDGTRNACSMLYGASRRAARAMGHSPVITYTLPNEGGASLRAAGFVLDKEDAGRPAAGWQNRPGRSVLPIEDEPRRRQMAMEGLPMTCAPCKRAETDAAGGIVYTVGCRGCRVRQVARMPPVHRELEFNAILGAAARETFKAECRTEFARLRALREKAT